MLYEGGVRVPHVFCWPGHIPPGTSCDQPVTSVDLYSTLLEVARSKGIKGFVANARSPVDYALDGVAYLSLLTGGGKSRLEREAIYWHFPGYLEMGDLGSPHRRTTVDLETAV